MILSSKGTILTNFHVIQPWVGGRGWGDGGGGWKERRIPIALSDGRCFDAQLLAFDQNFDVAVLEIIAPPSALPFPFLELGVSKNLRVGEWALAVGAPLNLGKTGLFFFIFLSFFFSFFSICIHFSFSHCGDYQQLGKE